MKSKVVTYSTAIHRREKFSCCFTWLAAWLTQEKQFLFRNASLATSYVIENQVCCRENNTTDRCSFFLLYYFPSLGVVFLFFLLLCILSVLDVVLVVRSIDFCGYFNGIRQCNVSIYAVPDGYPLPL